MEIMGYTAKNQAYLMRAKLSNKINKFTPKTQNNSKDYYITNNQTSEAYGRINTNLDDCRHWIINHLDLSLGWIITLPKTQLF